MPRCLSSPTRRALALPPRWSGCVVAMVALAVAGCVADAAYAPPPVTDPTRLFWSLTLDHRAVTLSTVAPYDTIRLTATPRTVGGEPLTGLSTPTFTSSDLDRIRVDANGLVHAIGSGSQIEVVATLSAGNNRHADTVLINVTDTSTPPVLAAFTIHPDSTDSAKIALIDSKSVAARAFDAAGTPITGLSVYYAVSDPTTATIDRATGLLIGIRPGHLKVFATATAYGITKADTLPFTIGYPVIGLIGIMPQQDSVGQIIDVFNPTRVVVGPGAVVEFYNTTALATDVTFDDPTNVAQDDQDCASFPWMCGTGNIAPFGQLPNDSTGYSVIRARRFPVPGTYTFHSTIFHTTGAIVVVNDHNL